MKLTVAALALMATSVAAFTVQAPQRTTTRVFSSVEESAAKVTKKNDRLRMFKSEQFHRKGFKDVRTGVEETMEKQFESEMVKDLRSNDFVVEKDGVKVHLAKVRQPPLLHAST